MTASPLLTSEPMPLASAGGPRSRRFCWWVALLIALLAFGVYANSLHNDFAFDDYGIVKTNPLVTQHQWNTIWTSGYWPATGPTDVLYRPLTIYSYALNDFVAHGHPWTFHLVNVLLHALVTFLVMLLAYRLFRHNGIAAIAGLLFAVHPIHTEVVANVVGRAELLAAAWSLLALLLVLPDHLDWKQPTPPASRFRGVLAACCFLLAMFSKETPATLLFAVPTLDLLMWWNWARPKPHWFRFFRQRALWMYLPMALAFAVYMALRLYAVGLMTGQNGVSPVVNPLVVATPIERLLTPFMLLAKYITLMFWPAVLCAEYSRPSLMPVSNPLDPLVLVGMLCAAGAFAIAFGYARRHPAAAASAGLMIFAYALVANFLRIGTIFGERLFYWPSAFLVMLLAAGAVVLWNRAQTARFSRGLRTVGVCVLAVAVAAMGVRTWVRNPDWKDNVSLALATASENTQSAKVLSWAGAVLSSATGGWPREYAHTLFARAIKLDPTFGDAYFNQARAYGHEDKLDLSLLNLAKAAEFLPGKLEIRTGLTAIKSDIAKSDSTEILKTIAAARVVHPQDPSLLLARGVVEAAQGQLDAAAESFNWALALNPRYLEADAELGVIRHRQGRNLEALNLLRRYVMARPDNVEARCELVEVLLSLDPSQYPFAWPEAGMNLRHAIAHNKTIKIQELKLRWEQARPLAGQPRDERLSRR